MKVLIISHNPLCTYNNMGKTLLSLFSEFKREELCQLYIYPSLPDVEKCDSYYQITDKDVLKGCLTFSVKGRVQKPDVYNHSPFENPNDEVRYRNPKNRSAFRTLCRDAMWSLSNWYGRDLKEWIKEQNPTCIFLVPGQAKFIYNVAIRLSTKYQLPIVTYFADDFYFLSRPKGALARLQHRLLKNKTEETAKLSRHFVTICEEMRQGYEKYFSIPTSTIMTGATAPIAEMPQVKEHPRVITYMGNIRCNRWHSLAEVGRMLDGINEEQKANYELHIYSDEKDTQILLSFDEIHSIKMCGYVAGEEYQQIFNSAEMFIHVEAFDRESIDLVKHSISTKIADCLASGRPLIAYGPSEIASISYLKRNACAYVMTEADDLFQGLQESLGDTVDWKCIAGRALETAKEHHDRQRNSIMLREILRK